MTNAAPYPITVAEFRDALRAVRERIDAAAQPNQHVRLLPVSKTVDADRLRHAIVAGCDRFGENNVQEARLKSDLLAETGVAWSIIGHLQTNKARFVARFASEFQALDSVRLANILQHHLEREQRSLDIFVQVNTSREPQKFGIAPEKVEWFVEQLDPFTRLNVVGLMTLAAFDQNANVVQACFEQLRTLRDRVAVNAPDRMNIQQLSMGMSGDFELAVAEGSTCVRVGQAIFGKRRPTQAAGKG